MARSLYLVLTPTVCRRYGCVDAAAHLGFCQRCVVCYRSRRRRDELALQRIAVVLDAAAPPFATLGAPGVRVELALQVAAELAFADSSGSQRDHVWRRALVALLADYTQS